MYEKPKCIPLEEENVENVVHASGVLLVVLVVVLVLVPVP